MHDFINTTFHETRTYSAMPETLEASTVYSNNYFTFEGASERESPSFELDMDMPWKIDWLRQLRDERVFEFASKNSPF